MNFEGKVVVVTGAGAGIGRATVERFHALGARIVAGDIDPARLESLSGSLTSGSGTVVVQAGDIARQADAEALVDRAKSEFGRLDILVNNAGIVDRFLPVGELTNEVWEKVMGINVNGVMYTMRRAVPIMLEQGSGVIVNVGSTASMGGGFAGAAYTTSKHAVVGLTRNTAIMYAKEGIRCVGVMPGGVNTGIPLGGDPSQFGYGKLGPGFATMPRVGEPVEVANAIVMLASDEASFVNGAMLAVDGGWLALG